MYLPSSTYRIQFNKEYTFQNFQSIINYLEKLGVSTVYASPVLKAVPGSMHGYDVADPHAINPEIGSLEEFKKISGILKKKNMSWLQDIVPNHMAFDLSNDRLKDVLERGQSSEYYSYFDINWKHPSKELRRKIMAPFLGDELAKCLGNKEIQISFSDKGFTIDYYDYSFPLSIPAWNHLLSLSTFTDENTRKTFEGLVAYATSGATCKEWQKYKTNCIVTLKNSSAGQKEIDNTLAYINGDPVEMDRLLHHQHYLLTFWKQTEKEINYRRFFTVNTLICLRMEERSVFDEYHLFTHTLFKEGLIQGLRIDHIDGLNDPSEYIKRLRKLFGESCYIIAEKILEAKEDMPEYWPLQGTSGYEFLSYTNQLFTSREGAKQLITFYQGLLPDMPPYKKLAYDNKKLILENYMAGEWNNLVDYFIELKLHQNPEAEKIRQALGLFMMSLPVYRIYPDRLPLKGKSLALMNEAFARAKQYGPEYMTHLEYMHKLFTEHPASEDLHFRIIKFLKKLMQFTGPLTAKGVEDTTFYVYNPLISHDEVGDAPSTLGITIREFHNKMKARQHLTPLSLNATATHDTKRGEDARLRLNVLSELPGLWQENVEKWIKMNNPFHIEVNGKPAPGLNDEYFIYQSITGGFPEDLVVTDEWLQRLGEYMIKAVREAKINSSWESPDEKYETACINFIQHIHRESHGFLKSFLPFVKKISQAANIYALCQVLIKVTAPGIPDIYRGCELWDLSFVDPDNRRPVDYNRRIEYLEKIMLKEKEGTGALLSFLKSNRDKGMEKLFVTWKSLTFRRENDELFTNGDYIPVSITGEKISAVAYARHYHNKWVLVGVPLGVADKEDISFTGDDFKIELPKKAPRRWQNIFTGEFLITSDGHLSLQSIFKNFPVACYTSTNEPA